MDARAWERMGEAGDDDMSERSPWATAGIASRDVDAAMGCQDIVPNGATGRRCQTLIRVNDEPRSVGELNSS